MQSLKSYFLFYKPYGVLSQFTPKAGHQSLANFGPFPKNIYTVGRLDADSEGILLLTDDNIVKHRLTDPKYDHPKTYLVQVEGIPDKHDIDCLNNGVIIERKLTKPANAIVLEQEPKLPPRSTTIRTRKNISTSWMKIVLREGRNRQIRKMTAVVGHPTLRLIRIAILFLTLDGMKLGEQRPLKSEEIKKLYNALHIR